MKQLTKQSYWLGFDLGGTKMSACVFNDRFTLLGMEKRKTRSQDGVKAGLLRMVETILGALDQAQIQPSSLRGIGIGYPGPVNSEKGLILSSPNLGWKNLSLRKALQNYFHTPVFLLNDVDAGVYGESVFGAGRKARCVVGIFIGTGIGGGCVYEGTILQGRAASCFEVGHMQVLPEGPLCGCGKRGCLEAVASRLAISAAAAVSAQRGESPFLLKSAGMDLTKIRSSVLAASIGAKDQTVRKIVQEAARWIGIGVANLVNLLLPEIVILGGGVVEAMPDLFCREVLKTANDRTMPVFQNRFKVVPASLGDHATALGVAAFARKSVLAKKSRGITS
jgi:glucokinase